MKMTSLKETIQIPRWIIIALIPACLTLVSWTIAANINAKKEIKENITIQTEMKSDITNLKKSCESLEQTKANKETVLLIYESVKRIEKKFDDVILSKK